MKSKPVKTAWGAEWSSALMSHAGSLPRPPSLSGGQAVIVGFHIAAKGNCTLAFPKVLAISGTCKFHLGVKGSETEKQHCFGLWSQSPKECENLPCSCQLK